MAIPRGVTACLGLTQRCIIMPIPKTIFAVSTARANEIWSKMVKSGLTFEWIDLRNELKKDPDKHARYGENGRYPNTRRIVLGQQNFSKVVCTVSTKFIDKDVVVHSSRIDY